MLHSVTARCKNDPFVYQACGFNTPIKDTCIDQLCGGSFVQDGKFSVYRENKKCKNSNQVPNVTIQET